jgi:hypothetical protein
MIYRNGDTPTTQIGYISPNEQEVLGTRDVKGNDHLQYSYKMKCTKCGNVYGANGADIYQRKCPKCQGGMAGIEY